MFSDEFMSDSELDEDWDEEEQDDDGPSQLAASYACEECDYRWDVVAEDDLGYGELKDVADDIICPMCGSTYVTQI